MTRLLRVVIDTNILISALIFGGGKVAAIRVGWQTNRFQPLVSRPTVIELLRVLAYPKFKLHPTEQDTLLADYLPFCTIVPIPAELPEIPPCRDPYDEPFLHLALAGQADYLVTGDQDLLALVNVFECSIVTGAQFLAILPPIPQN
jgi:uncharacterized protein